jgi:hypothetical protein
MLGGFIVKVHVWLYKIHLHFLWVKMHNVDVLVVPFICGFTVMA